MRRTLWILSFSLFCSLPISTDSYAEELEQADSFNEKLKRGTDLYQNKQYEAAIVQFQGAYAIKPDPILLYNLGQAHRKLNRDAEALNYYQFFLRTATQAAPEMRTKVEGYVRELQGNIKQREQGPAPKTVYVSTERAPRPRWRIVVGAVGLAAGVVLVGYGARALSAHGKCGAPPENANGECAQIYSTLPVGAPIVAVGGLLAVSGAVLVAVPGPRIEIAREQTAVGRTVDVDTGAGLVFGARF